MDESHASELKRLLGPTGPLAEAWPGYETRPDKINMALEVDRVFASGGIAVIEAGTGIGKTLAYLLPALLSRKKTLISTGLKNLQDQIHKKDLGLIRRYFGGDFTAALVKGRENYLCLSKYRKNFKSIDLLRESGQKAQAARLGEWVDATRDGDLETLPREVSDFIPRGSLSRPRETCLGLQCPQAEDCFFQRNRREAQVADLVLVNHHLFMADLAVREGGGKVLPDWEQAVFDEAHALEDVATSWFGRVVETSELAKVSELVRTFFDGPTKNQGDHLDDARLAENLLQAQADLPELFEKMKNEELLYPERGPRVENNQRVKSLLASLSEMGQALLARLPISPADGQDDEEGERIGLLRARLSQVASDLAFLAKADDPAFVYQVERRSRESLTLSALPIQAGLVLGRKLLEAERPVVMTSATLSAGGDFSYLRGRLGLPDPTPGVATLYIPSPYDYANNTILYVPRPFPKPNDPDYQEELETELVNILTVAKGRALLLFTSNASLYATAKGLRRQKLPWRLLVQESGTDRAALLRSFRGEVSSVLMATASFWQGIDVPGESLSAVVIDKLPFPVPSTPLFEARSRAVKEAGGDSFRELSIPQMVISLRQGLGRLLRSSTDRGLLAVMDVRLLTQPSYAAQVQRMLPPSPLTSDFKDVKKFMKGI